MVHVTLTPQGPAAGVPAFPALHLPPHLSPSSRHRVVMGMGGDVHTQASPPHLMQAEASSTGLPPPPGLCAVKYASLLFEP